MNHIPKILGLTIVVVSLAAAAASYWFHISNAGPEYVSTTFSQDQGSEFDGANRIARAFLHYTTPSAMAKVLIGKGDDVYISYHDGQIAKFKVISPTNTIRLRFDKTVMSVPADSRQNGFENSGDVSSSTASVGISSRADFVDGAGASWFQEAYEKRGSVEVILYNDTWAAGGGGDEWTNIP